MDQLRFCAMVICCGLIELRSKTGRIPVFPLHSPLFDNWLHELAHHACAPPALQRTLEFSQTAAGHLICRQADQLRCLMQIMPGDEAGEAWTGYGFAYATRVLNQYPDLTLEHFERWALATRVSLRSVRPYHRVQQR